MFHTALKQLQRAVDPNAMENRGLGPNVTVSKMALQELLADHERQDKLLRKIAEVGEYAKTNPTIYDTARTRIEWAERDKSSVLVIIGRNERRYVHNKGVTFCHTPGMYEWLMREADKLHMAATGEPALIPDTEERP